MNPSTASASPIQPGRQVGPYLLLECIGQGGMGAVYRAKDARLGREVAVKVLLPELARDPERLHRFENEARIIGSLNHPNLMAVYDTGTVEGHPYLVCELLDGEPLRARMGAGPMSPTRAVDYLRQIAQGLAAAHAQGVIHRDLKPENVFITRQGFVKLLDFGLAKNIGFASDRDATTLTCGPGVPAHTQAGMILGTVAYMSPEQIRGETLDGRSDIFALGLILYEMLTGRNPFRATSTIETLSAILKEEVPPMTPASGVVPVQLERLMLRCLEKDPAQRYQSVDDLVFQLQNLPELPTMEHARPGRPGLSRRGFLGAVSTALAGAAGLGGGLLLGRRSAGSPRFTRLATGQGPIHAARFVPGGLSVLFSASWDGQPPSLYALSTKTQVHRELGIRNAQLLAVSSREEIVVAQHPVLRSGSLSGPLFQASVAGSGMANVAPQGDGACYTRDGSQLAIVTARSESGSSLELPPGKPLYVSPNDLRHPRMSEDRIVLFEDAGLWGSTSGTLIEVDLRGQRRDLTRVEELTGLALGPGQDIWYSTHREGESCIHALGRRGEPRLLLRHSGRLELQDVGEDGRALATLATQHQGMRMLGPGMTEPRDFGWQGAYRCYGLSHDGRRLLLGASGGWFSLKGPLYLRDAEGSPAIRVCEGLGDACLSPDGTWIATGTPEGAALVPATGGTPLPLRLDGLSPVSFPGIFPDNRRVLSMTRDAQGRSTFHVFSPDAPPRLLCPAGRSHFNSQDVISPDGRWMALLRDRLASQDSGVPRILILSTEDGTERASFPLEFAEAVIGWQGNAEGLYLLDRNRMPAILTHLDLGTGKRRLHARLGPADHSGIWGLSNLKVTPDGRHHAYSFFQQFSQLYLVEGLG